MQRTLGDYIKAKREEFGLNQTELARRSGVPRETINRIENAKTLLPSADSRRRLAKALGVSHLDLLVAAGEIDPEEIRAAGAEGVVERDPNDLRAQLHAAIDDVPNWEIGIGTARTILWNAWAEQWDQTPHAPGDTMPAPPLLNSGQGRR